MENNNLNSNDFLTDNNDGQDMNTQSERETQVLNTEHESPRVDTPAGSEVSAETQPEDGVAKPDEAAEFEFTATENNDAENVAPPNNYGNMGMGQGGYSFGGDTYGTQQNPINKYPNAVHGYPLPKKLEDDPSNKKGMRVFAAILAVVIVAVTFMAGGYFLGRSSLGGDPNVITPDLQSKNEGEPADITGVFNNTINSVVQIKAYNKNSVSTASGVIYTSDGYIITNDHIYSEIPSPKFMVTTYDGKQYEAKYVAGDTRSDLAVLKIDATDLPCAVFGDSNELIIGEQVAAIGYPSTSLNVNPSLTRGIVSSLNARISTTTAYSAKCIQTDTAINPGSSGGVLVNMYSQVVGITSAKLVSEDCEGVGYAIPSSSVKYVVDLLINEGYVKGRAKLGITYNEVDSVYSIVAEVPTGLYVQSVSSDSSLADIGLEKGDIITHVNDVAIIDSTVMLDVIESSSAGDQMFITVYDGQTKQSATYSVELVEDAGSSSYTTADEIGNGESSEEYSSGFDFPAGE